MDLLAKNKPKLKADPLRRSLALSIADRRARKRWTQYDLAAAVGRSVEMIRGYEQQKRWPDPEEITEIARALEVRSKDLLFPTMGDARPKKLTLLERIAALEDPEAEALFPVVEEFLAGLHGEPSPSGAIEPEDEESDESGEQGRNG